MFIDEDGPGPKPYCRGEMDLFFSPDDDGRDESGRRQRESDAKAICFRCPFRLRCLEAALVHGERYGVWGAMGEGERKRFVSHLVREGYKFGEVPKGLELYAAVRSFYRFQYERENNQLHVLRKQCA